MKIISHDGKILILKKQNCLVKINLY